MGKGQNFERQFCKKLSLWWTFGERDDVFWRSPASGAVATIREKSNKVITKNVIGDVMAVHPIGEPLMDLVFFELKKGYGYIRLLDLFKMQTSNIHKWLADCNIKRVEYGLEFFLVVSHRTQKLMFISDGLASKMNSLVNIHVTGITIKSASLGTFMVVPYEEFFRLVSADKFMEAVNEN